MQTTSWQVFIECEQVVPDHELDHDDREFKPAGEGGEGATKEYGPYEVYGLLEEDAVYAALDRFHAEVPISNLESFVNPPSRVLRIVELEEGEECIVRTPAHDFRVSVATEDDPSPGFAAVHTDSRFRYWQGSDDVGQHQSIFDTAYLSDAR